MFALDIFGHGVSHKEPTTFLSFSTKVIQIRIVELKQSNHCLIKKSKTVYCLPGCGKFNTNFISGFFIGPFICGCCMIKEANSLILYMNHKCASS